MDEELLYFNGINGATGEYLLTSMSAADLGNVAKGVTRQVEKAHLDELRYRISVAKEGHFALAEGYDPLDLSQTGWGVIFSASWWEEDLAAVREALSELLNHRRNVAGDLYREYSGEDGYIPGESKDQFTSRHGAGPGDVKPEQIPYYLLIVGDPQTIPYQFQYELDVAYAVGRIHFDTLDEYAQYARSVVTSETSPDLKLKRQAVFFPVANPDDKATNLSAELLVNPLVEQLKIRKPKDERPEWDLMTLSPEECTKARLGTLLGGAETPAFLFTASHGMGFPKDHSYQLPFQGALLCQDWPGPRVRAPQVPRDYYFGAEDIGSDASLLGLVSFHFACYGAGTPYWDDYSKQAFGKRNPIAPHAFLSALPKRLLSHPKGGALAVVGHVERAWTYSFNWKDAGSQTASFESTLYGIMAGKTVGLALERMNMRYAEVATTLSNLVERSEYQPKKVSPYDLAGQWTAHNDARGYALLGDPAVRLPIALGDAKPGKRIAVKPVEIRAGDVPAVPFGEEETPPEPVAEPAATMAPAMGGAGGPEMAGVADFGSLGDMAQNIRDSLGETLKKLADSLRTFADNITTLDVVTYTSDRIENVTTNAAAPNPLSRFTNATPRAWTRIRLDGDTEVVVPTEAGEIDQALWEVHISMVQQAQTNRTEMLKAAAEVITSLLPKGS